MSPRPTTYWDYIRVEDLLALQGGLGDDDRALSDDEVRFIVVHQIDELWFKLVLRELASARDAFRGDHVPETALSSTAACLRRVRLLFDLAAQHFRLMETMATQDYLGFRDKLSPASGFQSAQMREIEILMGLEEDDRIPFGHEPSYREALRDPGGGSSPALARVRRRMEDRPTLREAVYRWLHRTPIQASRPADPGDAAVVEQWIEGFLDGHRRSQRAQIEHTHRQALSDEDRDRLGERYDEQLERARTWLEAGDGGTAEERGYHRRLRAALLFIDSHRELPLLSWPAQIIDGLIEAEQAMLVFRQRHARMVERVIGRRVGTGGSDGVDYLDRTALAYRVFKDVWAARTLLLPAELTPAVEDPDYYGLKVE